MDSAHGLAMERSADGVGKLAYDLYALQPLEQKGGVASGDDGVE